jgi:hypothetical protein
MQFVIRCDDFGFLPSTPKQSDVGLRLARRFHEALSGLPYLAGIIPAFVDSGGLTWLSSKPAGLTIALHGWDHSRVDGVDSEFRGKSLEECREMLYRGQKLLNGPHAHLIPPFNGMEPDLPEACYLEGIKYIWGAPSSWPTPPQPHGIGRITFVPSWKPLYAATLWQIGRDDSPLNGILPSLLGQPGKAVITLHVTWEAAKCQNFEGVCWLVDLIGDRVISPDEYTK